MVSSELQLFKKTCQLVSIKIKGKNAFILIQKLIHHEQEKKQTLMGSGKYQEVVGVFFKLFL